MQPRTRKLFGDICLPSHPGLTSDSLWDAMAYDHTTTAVHHVSTPSVFVLVVFAHKAHYSHSTSMFIHRALLRSKSIIS